MNLMTAITESTCGEACWQAREDVCRCSCGGKNHAVLRGQGVRPERTRKLNGHLYQLVAVENVNASCRAVAEHELMDNVKAPVMRGAIDSGLWERYQWDSTPGYPVKIKVATESEVNRWPEFTANREHLPYRPLGAWVRCDCAHFVPSIGG